MTQHPLFSVLIANYNNGKYLQEAIDSVVAQTYTNWEVIIVDDGSTDNSKKIYSQLESSRKISIHYNESNKGCGYTKRRCVELAQGEVCGFLDADDCLLPEAIDEMMAAHSANPDCSLVYSQYYYADENLIIGDVSAHQCAISREKSFLSCGIDGAISHFATFKRDNYFKTPGINPDMLRAVDIDLYLKLEEAGGMLFLPKPLYIYRCGTGNNISLGSDNARKAVYWDFLARVEACQRRHLNIETVAFPKLDSLFTCVKGDALQQGEARVRKSKAYRLGKRILTPFAWIKRRT